MTILDILKKNSSSDQPIKITRKKWKQENKQSVFTIEIKYGSFYDGEEKYTLDIEDILANDWSFQKKVWVEK